MCKSGEMAVSISDIEVSLNLATYSKDQQDIHYTDRVQIAENGRIQFSLLAQIKQKKPIKEQEVKLELVFFKDAQREKSEDEGKKDSTLVSQQVSRILLESIPLSREKEEGTAKKVLIRDPWRIRQNIKLNLSGIPIKGAGNYAVVAYLGSAGEVSTSYPTELIFLDCAYFEVCNAE